MTTPQDSSQPRQNQPQRSPKQEPAPPSDVKDEEYAIFVAKFRRNGFEDDKWPNGPRTSIEHYEWQEIREGRLEPLFRVFWRNRLKFYDEESKN